MSEYVKAEGLPPIPADVLDLMERHFGHPFSPDKAVLSLIQEVRESRKNKGAAHQNREEKPRA